MCLGFGRRVSPRQASYFFLLRQKEVTKKKATPEAAPQALRAWAHAAAAKKLALRAQTVFASKAPRRTCQPRCVLWGPNNTAPRPTCVLALLAGRLPRCTPRGQVGSSETAHRRLPPTNPMTTAGRRARTDATASAGRGGPSRPWGPVGRTGYFGAAGECLRRKLFEPAGRVFSPPRRAWQTRGPQARSAWGAASGVAFFLVTSFWRSKKK